MEQLLQELIRWVGDNPGWSYLVVLVVALAESLALVGMAVPGVLVMLAAGALIAAGELAFWPTCLAAVAGAVVGDGLSYWIGQRYRDRLCATWPFNRFPGQLERGVDFFQRYGAKSIVLGRFFGPGRAVVPLVAGILCMAPRKFLLANVTSALVWAPAYLAPGIVFGASLKLAAEATARLALLLLLLLVVGWLGIWSARRLYHWLSPRASICVQAMLRWADVHPKIGRVAQALADPAHPEAATLTGLAAALLIAAALLSASLGAGVAGSTELMLNRIALDLGLSLHTPVADDLMRLLDQLGSVTVLGVIALAVLVFLQASRARRDAGYWLAAGSFALIATPLLGWMLAIPRPDLGLGIAWPWSFPSPAVLGTTLVYGFLAIMLSRGLPEPARWLPYAAATLLVLAVVLARLYFGIEWLSDVIGSLALGLAWISALGLAYRRHTRGPRRWPRLAAVALLALSAGLALAQSAPWTKDAGAYRAKSPVQTISIAQWRAGDCDLLPRRRQDLWRRNQRPFDLVYAGAPGRLIDALAPLDWRPAETLAWSNLLQLLSPSAPLAELPVVSHVHDGRDEDVTLARDTEPGTRFVLRLWRTGCRIAPATPVWVGAVTALRKETVADLLALPMTVPDAGKAREALLADLRRNGAFIAQAGEPALIAPAGSGLLDDRERPSPRAQPDAAGSDSASASSSR